MISNLLQRFILTSIDSVPHLEAILLLRYDPNKEWNSKMLAQGLYLNEKSAEKILHELHAQQMIGKHDDAYVYAPAAPGLKEIIDELADIYSKNLIEVTNLIHSKTHKQAQQFGDAFKLRENDQCQE